MGTGLRGGAGSVGECAFPAHGRAIGQRMPGYRAGEHERSFRRRSPDSIPAIASYEEGQVIFVPRVRAGSVALTSKMSNEDFEKSSRWPIFRPKTRAPAHKIMAKGPSVPGRTESGGDSSCGGRKGRSHNTTRSVPGPWTGGRVPAGWPGRKSVAWCGSTPTKSRRSRFRGRAGGRPGKVNFIITRQSHEAGAAAVVAPALGWLRQPQLLERLTDGWHLGHLRPVIGNRGQSRVRMPHERLPLEVGQLFLTEQFVDCLS